MEVVKIVLLLIVAWCSFWNGLWLIIIFRELGDMEKIISNIPEVIKDAEERRWKM